jgi:hypothetical protein
MLEYQAEFGERATICEPNGSVCVSQHKDEIQQDDCPSWSNYALFVFEQQGSYCQLG